MASAQPFEELSWIRMRKSSNCISSNGRLYVHTHQNMADPQPLCGAVGHRAFAFSICSLLSHLIRQPRSQADIFISASSRILAQLRPRSCLKPTRRGPRFRVQYVSRPSSVSSAIPGVRQCAEQLQCDACKHRKVRCDKGSPWYATNLRVT
jgi:hypothetical protein